MSAAIPARRTIEADTESAIDRFVTLLQDDLGAVNALIRDRMVSPVPLIPQLATHLIEAGGKRLRPMLTLAAARLCGYQGSHHITLAAVVEFIHTATLLHDDVVDNSTLRRGKKAANVLWGNQASVLVGDFLFSRSFQLMVETGSLEVLDILANAAAVIAEGEVMQLAATSDVETSEETYLKVISAKTAALFAAAAKVGGVIAERPRREVDALDAYGRNLGVAFQLVDDALDYVSHNDKFGKTVGDDFREGKITLPAIVAYARGAADERLFWKRTLGERRQQDTDLAEAVHLMEKHRALEETLTRAQAAAGIAKAALAVFPDGIYRRSLAELADFCVDRAY